MNNLKNQLAIVHTTKLNIVKEEGKATLIGMAKVKDGVSVIDRKDLIDVFDSMIIKVLEASSYRPIANKEAQYTFAPAFKNEIMEGPKDLSRFRKYDQLIDRYIETINRQKERAHE